jgi:far upstream element-binding protein
MEIVDSDTKQMDAGGHQQPQHQQPNQKRDFDPYGGGAGGGNKINDSIMVPSDAVGMIIGKGKTVVLLYSRVVLIQFRW